MKEEEPIQVDQDTKSIARSDNSRSSLALEIQEEPYDFRALFGNDHPVELEIGLGKGRFLLSEAEKHPERNFVGIEWASKYYRLVLRRAERKRLHNLRLLRDDAFHTFQCALADHSLAGVHVYFPDPWPKKRHLKRRMIQRKFLDLAVLRVVPGGFLKLATDHVDYFSQMVRECESHPRVKIVNRLEGESARQGVTNYEVKYRAEGRRIHNLDCDILA